MALACVDTHYSDDGSRTALVLFEEWGDAAPLREVVEERTGGVAAYVPGEFYRRELPCLLSILQPLAGGIGTVIIDGYVWLDGRGRKGLGAWLYESLGRSIPVIGVAKSRFAGCCGAEVFRGQSTRPLIVTAAGLEEAEAARRIRSMHGAHRIPTLLKRADDLSRRGGGPA